MSPREVLFRVIDKIQRWPGFRHYAAKSYRLRSTRISTRFVDVVTAAEGGGLILQALEDRFFFGPADQRSLVSAIEQHCPDSVDAAISYSEDVLAKRFVVLGHEVRWRGGMPDWHADPETGVKPWTLDQFSEADAIRTEGADVKYVWELNRHQFLPVLGRAFWFTNDMKYCDFVTSVLSDWIDENPCGKGVNWCSHLEVAMRLMSWMWTMPHLTSVLHSDKQFARKWCRSIAEHYHHLSENLSVYTDPTNHLIGEATSLWLASYCFNMLPHAARQQERCERILLEELVAQTHTDGINKEQSSSYHRFVLDFFSQLIVLKRKSGSGLGAQQELLIERMFEYASMLQGGGNESPQIGDSDDARGIPFPEFGHEDFSDLVSTGAGIFFRDELRSTAPEIRAQSVWLLGPAIADRYKSSEGRIKHPEPTYFEAGGMMRLPGLLPECSADLLFDVGDLGLWPNAAHGHADALSVVVRVAGRAMLVDPGTGTYFGSPAARDAFRKTASHNTIAVDGMDQADIFDTFKWVNPFRIVGGDFFAGKRYSFGVAGHDGYRRLRNPVSHYRSVISTGRGEWAIYDVVTGVGEHSLELNYHFRPEHNVHQTADTGVSVVDPQSGYRLEVDVFATTAGKDRISSLEDDGLWSPAYGHFENASRFKSSTTTNLPATFVSMIRVANADSANSVGSTQRYFQHPDDGSGSLVVESQATTQTSRSFILVANPGETSVSLPHAGHTNASIALLELGIDNTLAGALIAGDDAYLQFGDSELRCPFGQGYLEYVGAMDSTRK